MGYYPDYEQEEPKKEPTYNEAFEDGVKYNKRQVLALLESNKDVKPGELYISLETIINKIKELK